MDNRVDIAAWCGVALLGLSCLYMPFHGDQVIHLLGAEKLQADGIIYRDFWDLKQPGIFYFYLLGGYLFGFSEVGIHSWELIYQLVLVVLMTYLIRPYFSTAGFAGLAGILSIGAYYAVAGPWHLTQIEAVVGAPLLLAAWTSSKAVGVSHRAFWLLVSGVAGGIVGLFKFVYLPVVASFWVSTLVCLCFLEPDHRLRRVLGSSGLIILGASIPIAVAGSYFIAHGLTEILYKTFFVYPLFVLKNVEPRYGVLLDGLRWVSAHFSVLLGFGLIGVYRVLLRPTPFLVNVVLWLVLGFVMVLAQRMWWQYHHLIVSVPVGLLAALGLDFLWHSLKQHDSGSCSTVAGRGVFVLAFVVGITPLTTNALKKVVHALVDRPWITESGLQRYRERYGNYRQRQAIAAFLLQPDSRSGDIFVFGDPTLYWLGRRGQAAAVHGWATDGYSEEQWRWLSRDLEKSKPPYIFVPPDEMDLIRQKSRELKALLDAEYQVFQNTDLGAWYERIDGSER